MESQCTFMCEMSPASLTQVSNSVSSFMLVSVIFSLLTLLPLGQPLTLKLLSVSLC